MRYRLILPIAALLAALVAVPAAQAKVQVGISEQNPAMFDQPSWQKLKLKRVRYIVSWDYAKHDVRARRGHRLHERRARPQAGGARRPSTRIVAASSTTSTQKTKACKAPSTKAYKAAVKGFRKAVPVRQDVRALERGQPRLAADVPQAEAGGQVLQGHEERVQEVHGHGGRRARLERRQELPAQVPARHEEQGPHLGPAQLQGRQPPPEQGHPQRRPRSPRARSG